MMTTVLFVSIMTIVHFVSIVTIKIALCLSNGNIAFASVMMTTAHFVSIIITVLFCFCLISSDAKSILGTNNSSNHQNIYTARFLLLKMSLQCSGLEYFSKFHSVYCLPSWMSLQEKTGVLHTTY